MKNLLLIVAATLISTSSVMAQGPAGTTLMVNKEFGVIAEKLELEPLQMHHLAKILEKKAEEVIPLQNQIKALEQRRDYIGDSDPQTVAYIENEISNIRARIKQAHTDADDALSEHLNDEQSLKYFSEVKPTLEENRKASTNQADASKK